ncbi:MAG: hypothetical protein ACM3SR_10370 [Ignavibacteriales bacterium]
MHKIGFIFIPLLILPFFISNSALADREGEKRKEIVLPKNEILNKDYFAAGNSVTLSGTVNGDVYLAGGSVIVEGIVNGDLLVAGGVVTIRGKITHDARIGGGQVIISGEIDGNLTAGGGSVNITDSAKIGGSLVAGAGSLLVFAPVGKGATIGAGRVTLGNKIGGDITAGVGQITLTPNANIIGNLVYWSKSNAQIEPGAQVLGKITHNLPAEFKPTKKIIILPLLILIGNLVSSLVIGLLMLKFLPVYTQRTANVITENPWASLGIGFLTTVLFPVIFIILLVTLVGIPIALILLFTFLIIAYITKVFVSLLIGQKIFKFIGRQTKSGWALVVGLIVYGIITIIPVIGWIVSMLVFLFGLGGVILVKKDFYHQLRSENRI